MAPYSNDPQINPYAHVPSPVPNIDFPTPFWINKLVNMSIIGCLDPDLVYAELAVAAAANMGWTLITPSTKQLIQEATGQSWICGSRQTLRGVTWGDEIANNGAGRFMYGALAGFDIAAYYAFMLSTGAKGVIDFGSYAAKFQRKCNGSQSKWRGLNPVGGWPSDTDQWLTGPSFFNAAGDLIGPRLVVPRGNIAAMIAWCSFSNLGGTGGVVVQMNITDEQTGQVLDLDIVDNLFSTSNFAVVRAFTTEGRAVQDTAWDLNVNFVESVGTRGVPVNGGCYIRSWAPTAADAPPYWDMKTMLHSKGG